MRIAVSNQKGGVGKTALSINIAGALNAAGHDVLLTDLDPQGHATEGLGFNDEYESDEPHLGTVLADIDEIDKVNEIVHEHEEMDVLPANLGMFTLETDLTGSMRSRERLEMAFDALSTTYDYIIIDCPPSLGHLTDNALLATQNVLIPALAEGTSIRALEILFDQVDSLEDGYGVDIEYLGLIANRVEQDGEAEDMMEWFRDTLGDRMPIWEVRKRVALKRAWNNGVSIYEHDEECDMLAVFDEVAAHLEAGRDE